MNYLTQLQAMIHGLENNPSITIERLEWGTPESDTDTATTYAEENWVYNGVFPGYADFAREVGSFELRWRSNTVTLNWYNDEAVGAINIIGPATT